MRPNLESNAPDVSAPKKSAIEIGIFIAGVDVGASHRNHRTDAPAPQVHPGLVGATFDTRPLQLPEFEEGEVGDPGVARVELVELDAVVENPDSPKLAVTRRHVRRPHPAAAKHCEAGDAVQQLA